MRVDIVTIFPSFFDVLDLSLLGRARQSGLIDVTAHDLRDFTHDRHRTVDDTPYGGGAGMVMKPEPWGEALDAIVGDGASDALLVVPSPAGEPFTQATARELAAEQHLVFACGRYEGIDQRVVDHYADAHARAAHQPRRLRAQRRRGRRHGDDRGRRATRARRRRQPREPRRGVARERPARVPELHKPAAWRGLDVPPVLLSGNHGAIAAWRHEQQVERTRRVRPELLDD